MGRLTPLDIRKQEFKQSALGFSRDQVIQFLEDVADELEKLIQENNEILKENSLLQEKLNSYRNVEQSMNEALVMAKDSAKKTVIAAQKESDSILLKAESEKEALLFNAKQELSKLQNDIQNLKIKKDGILLKVKNALVSHLEMLELEFGRTEEPAEEKPLIESQGDEKIVDFSKTDISIAEIEEQATNSEEKTNDKGDALTDS